MGTTSPGSHGHGHPARLRTVTQARDGDELLATARAFRPDLLLVDSAVPSEGGVAGAQRLREDPDFETVPVIAVSATASAQHRADRQRAGVDVFLAEPLAPPTSSWPPSGHSSSLNGARRPAGS